MKRLSSNSLLVAGATVLGCSLLAFLLPNAHPASKWGVRVDREQSIAKAREFAGAFGLDVSQWRVTANGGSNGKSFYFLLHPPGSTAQTRFTPVYPNVIFTAPGKTGQVEMELSATGAVNSWERRAFKKTGSTDPAAARTIAQHALNLFTAGGSRDYRLVSDAVASDGALMFAWERPGSVSLRFEATVDGTNLIKAQIKPVYSSKLDAPYRTRKKYIDWLDTISGVLIVLAGTLLSIGLYVYGLVRRAVNHAFALGLAIIGLAGDAISWFNWDRFAERDFIKIGDSSLTAWVSALLLGIFFALFYTVICGATDAVGRSSPKLVTLRSLFSRAAFNRRAGISIFAGLLWSPLIVALPLLVSSLHLFGSEQTGDINPDVVYAAHTAIQAIRHFLDVGVLGIFGVAAGFAALYIRKPALSFTALLIVGALLFGSFSMPSETSGISYVVKAVLVFFAYRLLFQRFDLLAVLSAAYGSHVIWSASALLIQPARSLHVSGMSALTFLTSVTFIAGLVAWRGRAVSIADTAPLPELATSQREALMAEFSIAHRVQQQMLPLEPPDIPGCSIAATCHPAREVGGDLFDFLKLPDGRWAIGVGDVSGKGVPASLYMTLTKGLLIATTQDSSDLLDIMANVNDHIHTVAQRKIFVTMALGAFDPETRMFDHVRAGHNPTVWRRSSENKTTWLTKPGMGLGMASGRLFKRATEIERVQLSEGDLLVFYSDGLTEAMNIDNEQFGEDRLAEAVEQAGATDANSVRESILTKVHAWLNGIPAQDDMTLVVLRVN